MQIPFVNRWHPVLALRYLPVVKQISKNQSVLEVGSGSLGIGPYLKRPFTGLDVNFSGPTWPQMQRLKSSATKIPKPNNSFDVVISMDMLEHLPAQKRQLAIAEMLRVANKKVIIGIPTGKLAHFQDKQLDQIYQQKHGKHNRFLKEQITFGLPEKKDILTTIKSAAKANNKTITTSITPNINLKVRFWLMRGWISQNFLVNIFFRKILIFFIPFLRLFNQSPVYRHIFIINFKTNE